MRSDYITQTIHCFGIGAARDGDFIRHIDNHRLGSFRVIITVVCHAIRPCEGFLAGAANLTIAAGDR